MDFISILACLAILAIIVFFIIITQEEKKPEVCDFGDLSFSKRPRQEESEVMKVAAARKKEEQSGKPTKPPSGGGDGNSLASVIFLDFDGHTVTGTNWNYIPEIVCAPSGLTLDEQLAILTQVQIDYAPFNVIVTSDEAIFNAGNPNKRIRCIITESWEWYGQVGGVALKNSFTWGNDTPCFIFSSLLAYDFKRIHESASHEIGHTIGLNHQAVWTDGIKMSDYNTGCCGEAPIMGKSWFQPVGKWWVGKDSNGVEQDDFQILSRVLGLK